MLSARLPELMKRVGNAERGERLKLTDANVLKAMVERGIFEFSHPNRLEIDTSDLTPTEAADKIGKHMKKVVGE